jgi:nucleoside-diphosphate-sugar epimerase
MRLLLTGSSGYIGSRLLPHLKAQGHSVVGVDRVPDTSSLLDDFIEGDLTEPAVAKAAVEGIDMVLHLAAAKGDWGIFADEFYRDNVEVTRVLLQAGRKRRIKNWIFYSTVATMGPSEVPIDETAPLSPVIPYGASKAEAEKSFLQLVEEDSDARIVIIRPSAVFGPDNPESTNIYRLIEAIYRNRFVMIGDGNNVKTTSYIENLIAATLFLMNRMRPGVQTYIYVDETALTTGELVKRIYGLLEKKQPRWRLPLSLTRPFAYLGDLVATLTGIDLPITAARVEKFCTSTNFDARAIRRLGFHQPVTNEEALQKTVRWHLDQQVRNGHGIDVRVLARL